MTLHLQVIGVTYFFNCFLQQQVGRPSNVPQAAPWIEQILEEARQYARIYISSIHPDLTETDIKRYDLFMM